MRILFFFFLALSLVDGVFGVDVTVSVMEGDSLTLKPQTEIPEDDTVEWWFGDTLIAQMNKAVGLFSTSEGDNGRFKDCLKLDHQTGSLNITNIRTDHAGLYTLKIGGTTETYKTFSVTVSDVVESVSVTEGDTVTLHTGVTDIQRGDVIKLFGDQGVLIADLKGPDGTRWRNIHRNNETGYLTIRNIQRNQAGDYELKINTASVILHRKLHITISDEMTTVSVKEGESITLDSGLIEIKGYDLIMWKFEDQLIAELNKGTNGFVKHDTSAGGRFKGRLQLHPRIVSLVISDSKITDSGDYHLNMNSSSHTIQRNISVTVSVSDKQTPDPGVSPGAVTVSDKQTPDPGSGLSSGAIAGIVVGVLLVFAAATGVIYRRWRISKQKRLRNVNTSTTHDFVLSDDL